MGQSGTDTEWRRRESVCPTDIYIMNKKQNTLEIIKFGHPERITGGMEPARGVDPGAPNIRSIISLPQQQRLSIFTILKTNFNKAGNYSKYC